MKHENWYNEKYMEARRKDVVDLAAAVIAEKIPFLDGVRALKSIQYQVTDKDFDDDFTLFVAIDSETDHLPATENRHECSSRWLEKCGKEINVYESHYREKVVATCEKLISRFGGHA